MEPRVPQDIEGRVFDLIVIGAVKHCGWDRERAEREVREYREWIERYTPKQFREPARASGGRS
jgi:glycerol-3-phosphate dehydrogenase